LKLGTIVIIDSLSKPVAFEFKRSIIRGTGSLAGVPLDYRRTHDEEQLFLSSSGEFVTPECNSFYFITV